MKPILTAGSLLACHKSYHSRMQRLGDYIRVYDQALAPEICAHLLATWQQQAAQQQRNGASVRQELANSAWTELDLAHTGDANLQQMLGQQLQSYFARYNQELGLTLPLSLPRGVDRWIVKRYAPGGGEGFQTHFDAVGPACRRYLVYLWYLNDVAEGGATRFVDLDIDIQPRAGRLLMFHPHNASLPFPHAPKMLRNFNPTSCHGGAGG